MSSLSWLLKEEKRRKENIHNQSELALVSPSLSGEGEDIVGGRKERLSCLRWRMASLPLSPLPLLYAV